MGRPILPDVAIFHGRFRTPLSRAYLIGMDFGTLSARGVLIDADRGHQVDHAIVPYRHGLLTAAPSDGVDLRTGAALHRPSDYLEACREVLSSLGTGKAILGIGIAATACSPLPVRTDGSTFEASHPREPHALIKLWKHSLAQPFAEAINHKSARGKVSGEGMFAKAAELAHECPDLWQQAGKFIEVGDWLVWQLVGAEHRSLDFAAYKTMYTRESGYPDDLVAGLTSKLGRPHAAGNVADCLSEEWLQTTGILGKPVVAVAMIDSHAVLPAVQVTGEPGFIGVLGTSSSFLRVGGRLGFLPRGYEAGAYGAVLPGLWCCEAGQAAFGDMLGWFVETVPARKGADHSFERYDTEMQLRLPAQGRLLALDWFGGNRVPHGDKSLSGLLLGLNVSTTPLDIYQALIEALAFGIRSIVEYGEADGLHIESPILAGTVALHNPYLAQTIADVLGRTVRVADLAYPTALGSAIHAAVASGVVSDFPEGASRFGCKSFTTFAPDGGRTAVYSEIYGSYSAMANDPVLKTAMKTLAALSPGSSST